MKTAFEGLPPEPRSHFLLHFFAAVHRLVGHIRRAGGKEDPLPEERYPFLSGYVGEMERFQPVGLDQHHGNLWWQQQIMAWEQAAGTHLPLLALPDLSFEQRLVLILAGLVEEDSRFGTLLAIFQAPLNARRPGLELVARLLDDPSAPGVPDPWHLCRPLLAAGLLVVPNEDDPRAEWTLRVPSLLWEVVRGDVPEQLAHWARYHLADTLPALETLILPTPFGERLAAVPGLLRRGECRTLVLRGRPGSAREEVVAAVARELGRNLLVISLPQALEAEQWRQIGPFCSMSRTLPLLRYELEPGETTVVPPLPGYRGPVAFILGQEGGLHGEAVERAVTLTLPGPDAALRRRLWQASLPAQSVEALQEISERFHLPAGYIRQAAGLAVTEAALEGRDVVGLPEVGRACRRLNRQILDTLATRVEVEGGCWAHLVVSDPVAARLRELEQRCRHRERLLANLGPAFGRSANRGVRALFSGGSGTGKTMAARVLAAELGMDLYRVDLAAVVNKYIGETEKNLHRVLGMAEALDVMLLLDEGDALLGSRTDIRSANDRYANLETNFLLQRLEGYEGIILITSNAAENIDSAFQRRLDVVVHFVPPQSEARWQIWQLHLPNDHCVDPALLEAVATRCEMTGGQIRNAALYATLLALDEGLPVASRHVEEAIQSEYRKAGAHFPFNGGGPNRRRSKRVEGFLGALS